MMGLFAPLAAYAANEVRGAVGRKVAVVVGYAVAGVGAIGLLIVALVSLHRYLGDLWGPYLADLSLAGLMLIVVIAGLVYAKVAARPPVDESKASALSAAAVASAPAALGLLRSGGRAGLVAVAAAVLMGVVAGRSTQK